MNFIYGLETKSKESTKKMNYCIITKTLNGEESKTCFESCDIGEALTVFNIKQALIYGDCILYRCPRGYKNEDTYEIIEDSRYKDY